MVCVMQSMATLVLPAPVGAHTSMFSLVLYAVSHTTDWILNGGWKIERKLLKRSILNKSS